MSWRRHIANALPAVVVAPIFFVVGRTVPADASVTAQAAAAGMSVAVAVAGLYVARRLADRLVPPEPWPVHLQTLRRILHSTSRSNTTRIAWTTIPEYASYEDRLNDGDIVYVLTHDLYMYDCHAGALRAIALNVLEGVRYIYLLDPAASGGMRDAFGAKLRTAIETEVRAYRKQGAASKVDGVGAELACIGNALARVEFFEIREPLLYPFSITQRPGAWGDAHWYAIGRPTKGASPESDDDKLRLLVVYVTNNDHIQELQNLFGELVKKPWSRPLPRISNER